MPGSKRKSARGVQAAGGRAADTRRREFLAIALILLAAVILRVVYVLQYRAHDPYYSAPVVDSRYYDAWALRVADGKGYGPTPFYMAPLYPYVLALVYAIAGHNLALVYILQATLGVVNLLLVYLLGRRLFGHGSGLAAMGLILLYAPLVYLESKILTETLAIALNLASLLLLMRALDRPTVVGSMAAGIVFGLSVVCRPTALVTIALVLVWLWFVGSRGKFRADDLARGFGTRHLAYLVFGIALAVLPVTARNYFVGKDFALISTNGGIVFAQANNSTANGVSAPLPGFTGWITTQREEEMAIAEKALGRPVKQSESSAYWFKAGVRFIREQPGRFSWLLVRKFVWALHNQEASCSYNPYLEMTLVPILRYLALPFSLLGGLALFRLCLRTREAIGGLPPACALCSFDLPQPNRFFG